MSGRHLRASWTAWIAAVALGGAVVGCADLICPDPELIGIEDGTYHGESDGVRPRIGAATAPIEGEELTIQYVQDTDGRTYRVRLREHE